MNPPKCDALDYIHFLVAAQKSFSCTEAARCQPDQEGALAHDAFTRLLRRQPPDTEALWQETQGLIARDAGVLVLDDTTLDKPYARKMALVSRHWSGKHRRVVWGINLLTLLWSDGAARIPCDFRVYDKPQSGKSKNDHFWDLLAVAGEQRFAPEYVLFDSWYASLENLKRVGAYGWHWLTQLKGNRQVNPDGQGNVSLERVEIPEAGRKVHLRGYGFIQVFRTVSKDGDVEHWATSNLDLSPERREVLAKEAWGIETYHRGLKQCCGVEKSAARKGEAQRNHILLSLQAFLRLEVHRLRTGVSWYEAKAAIVRDAVRQYLAHPSYLLAPTA
jgi:putative transposase